MELAPQVYKGQENNNEAVFCNQKLELWSMYSGFNTIKEW